MGRPAEAIQIRSNPPHFGTEHLDTFPTRGDKSVRAQSIRGRMALEGLHVPINKPWYADLRAELLAFPAGKHDDQVDALGLVGQLLDIMLTGQKPPEAEKPKTSSGYAPMWPRAELDDWRSY